MALSTYFKLLFSAYICSTGFVIAENLGDKEFSKNDVFAKSNILVNNTGPDNNNEFNISNILNQDCFFNSNNMASNFEAKINNGVVLLNWAEKSNNLVKEFVVERLINETYLPVGTITQLSNSTGNFYSFEDTIANNSVNFYRLKQIEYSGKFKYSDVINVNTVPTSIPEVDVRVINKGNFIDFVYNGKSEENTLIKIYNAAGKEELITLLPTFQDGPNAEQINISELKNGIFFMQITTAGSPSPKLLKFVK